MFIDVLGTLINAKHDVSQVSPDPDHSVNGTTWQIFGTPYPEPGAPVLMNGFVSNSRVHVRNFKKKMFSVLLGG